MKHLIIVLSVLIALGCGKKDNDDTVNYNPYNSYPDNNSPYPGNNSPYPGNNGGYYGKSVVTNKPEIVGTSEGCTVITFKTDYGNDLQTVAAVRVLRSNIPFSDVNDAQSEDYSYQINLNNCFTNSYTNDGNYCVFVTWDGNISYTDGFVGIQVLTADRRESPMSEVVDCR